MHRKSPSKMWRKFGSRYSLIGSKSKTTGKCYFPPVFVDPETHSIDLDKHEFNGQVKLITWSKVSAPSDGFERYKPYIVGILELENGERLTAQIVDVDYAYLQKGDVLYPTFRKYYEDGEDGVIHYGLKWTK